MEFRSLLPGEQAQTQQIPTAVTIGHFQIGSADQAARHSRIRAIPPITSRPNALLYPLLPTWHFGTSIAIRCRQASGHQLPSLCVSTFAATLDATFSLLQASPRSR